MCGINASGAQWCGYISTLCYIHLKLALLLHKTALVTFLLASTVRGFDAELSFQSQIFRPNIQLIIQWMIFLCEYRSKLITVTSKAFIFNYFQQILSCEIYPIFTRCQKVRVLIMGEILVRICVTNIRSPNKENGGFTDLKYWPQFTYCTLNFE